MRDYGAPQQGQQKWHIPQELYARGWKRLDSEVGWTLETDVGIAIVKLTRGYPRSRNFRVIVNGKDVDRFVRDPAEAMRIAEEQLEALVTKAGL